MQGRYNKIVQKSKISSNNNYFVKYATNDPYPLWDFENTWSVRPALLPELTWNVPPPIDSEISSCEELAEIGNHLTQDFVLMQDLDCYNIASTPLGISEAPFSGEFDGNGHSIKIYVGTGVYDYAGLFAKLDGAYIHDLSLEGLVIANGSNVGGLAGEAVGNTVVQDVSSAMEVQATGDNVGGLLGAVSNNVEGSFDHNSASGDVSGDENVGGLYGTVSLSGVNNSFATGDVTATGQNAGGLIGYVSGYGASTVYATGDVVGVQSVGGLIGQQYSGDVSDSYARGNATGASPGYYVGGLIGSTNDAHVTRTYSTGTATGNLAVGGLIGYSVGETYVYDSFTTGLVTGSDATVNAMIGQDASNFLIAANLYANADNSLPCMVNVDNESVNNCTQVSITDNPEAFFYSTDEPMLIGDEQVWIFGGQEGPWHEKLNDYPTLTPLRAPTILCEQATATDTTAHVACDYEPQGWGMTTWEMQVANVLSNSYKSVPLSDIHRAEATITGLQPGSIYSVRFRFTNDWGTSEWGRIEFATSGDIVSAEDGTPIALSFDGCILMRGVETSRESGLSRQDAAYNYPVGLLAFRLEDCGEGGTATVTAIFTGDFDPNNVVIRKANTDTGTFTTLTGANSGLQLTRTTLYGKPALRVVYQITDGGPFDQDGTVNGTIVDPIGVARLTTSVPNTGLAASN